jgi:peptidoglycan hydrolase-like protein with peptidoglycan-binding domain
MTQTLSVGERNAVFALFLSLLVALSLTIGFTFAHAASLSTQMGIGSTGGDVTSLQTYLAANPDLYPEGLVTGYFGSLTQAAIQRFQAAQSIVSSGTPATTGYGRVGPTTLARLNQLMGSTGNQAIVPVLGNTDVQYGRTGATITWMTNEATQGQVFFDTVSIRADEATAPHQQPYISGTLASDTRMQASHAVTLSGLQPNTTYFYLVRAIDSDGNISITWPPVSFHTTP